MELEKHMKEHMALGVEKLLGFITYIDGILKVGNSLDYFQIDTVNHEISVYTNGGLAGKWEST